MGKFLIFMLSKVRKIFKRKKVVESVILKPKTDKGVEPIRQDSNGNVFYIYKNFMDIPLTRHIATEIATTYASFNVTKEQLEKALDLIIESYNAQKYHEGITIAYELKQRLAFAASEQTLLQVACVFTLMNDENGDAFISSEQQAKMDAWAKDEETKDFFLRTAFELIKPSENTSDQDIVDYLKEMEKKTRNWLTTLKLMK